jgi:RND family efflux transporter MFP subunit
MMFTRGLRIFLTVLILPMMLAACGEGGQDTGAMPPAEVDVSLPLKRTLTEWDEYTGRFEAVEGVEIRARVTGYLQEIKFQDGQLVKKDDVLFVIDPRPFEYALQRAEAQYGLAEKEFKRAEGLLKSKAIAEEDFDNRLQELKVAEAALNEAKLDIEFTAVKSPIDGKVSRDFVNVGNLVRENETALTRIVSVDPIHFYFEASQTDLLKYIRMDREGTRPSSDHASNPIVIKLQDESDFIHKGKMDFVDNAVDAGTGTIQGRAIVPNPDAIIYPGLFGRARLMGSNEYEAILVPDSAINTDQSRKFVFVVNDQNQAQRRYVELGPIQDDGFYIIRSGLDGTERVVTGGIQRIRMPDQPVTPIDKPLDAPPAAAAAPQTP